MDSSVAPAEDEAATLTTIPGDALGVVQQFIGFHSSPAVSAVSTSLYKTEELAAARARQRLSLAAMPSLPSGPRDLRDRRLATEYLSLVPTTEGAQSRTIICAEYVQIGDRCRRFATPEPLTRYFAHVGNNHANMEVALSERYVYFPFFDRSGTVMYAPRSDWRFRSREQGPPYYEGAWEACYEWDVAGNNRQRLPSDNRHGGSNYNPDLSPAPSDHSDSDSDSEGDVEGVHWEWSRPNPFMGGRRYKIRLSQRERRKRRRAARNS